MRSDVADMKGLLKNPTTLRKLMDDECRIDPFEIETRGVRDGINPMFGEWHQTFKLEPVSYSNGGDARTNFKAQVRSQLSNKYVFVGEVSLRIVLYLNEQKMLETPSFGDIDNHAKQLLDTFKGHGGLLIDDCQVQHLDISWIDVPHGSHFEIAIKGSPDDFMPTPLRLYEMPDGLYYPLSHQAWTREGLRPVSDDQLLCVANALAKMTKQKRARRHELRQAGMAQLHAYQQSRCFSPILMGFHRTRIEQSGFELVPINSWKSS